MSVILPNLYLMLPNLSMMLPKFVHSVTISLYVMLPLYFMSFLLNESLCKSVLFKSISFSSGYHTNTILFIFKFDFSF